jgi:hypothetical protein
MLELLIVSQGCGRLPRAIQLHCGVLEQRLVVAWTYRRDTPVTQTNLPSGNRR